MESGLESLPFELLEEICHRIIPAQSETIQQDILVSTKCRRFPYSDLARVLRTCKRLHSHVEPLLYGSRTARTIALYRAIREGNVNTIRKAIAYGASPDMLKVAGSLFDEVMYGDKNCWNVPALYLALKFRQPAAFQALVEEHGADIHHPALWRLPKSRESFIKYGIDDYDYPYDICLGNKIVRHLCHPCNEKSLRLLLDRAGPDSPSDCENGDQPRDKNPLPLERIPLVSVMSWASLDLLQLLLDKKVDPNGLHPGLGHQYMSPLSAAVLLRLPEKFKLLLSGGADINGKSLVMETFPIHIPVFAAITQMLQGPSGLAMMKLCLDHGADINQPCYLTDDFPIRRMDGVDEIPHIYTTALFEFLKSVQSWSCLQPGEMSPLLGLQYLLDAGASAVGPPSEPIQRRHINTQQLLHDRTYGGVSSAVELLLNKHSLRSVSNQPRLFEALEMLISHGDVQSFHARILVKYDSIQESGGWTCPDDVATWRRLLDLLIDDMKKRDVNIDAVLRRVIADKGKLRKTISHSPWRGVGEIGRASIDALIAAGANINARIDVPWKEATARNCDTALQEVCTAFIHTDWLYEDIHDHADASQLCEYSLMNATTYGEWFAFLVSRGADPWLHDTHKHKEDGSAISIILSPIKEGRARIDGRGSLERHLMGLFNVLRGVSAPVVYQGERAEKDWVQEFGWLSTSLQRGRNASGAQCLPR